jgi:hypothetical protein
MNGKGAGILLGFQFHENRLRVSIQLPQMENLSVYRRKQQAQEKEK